MTSSKLDNYLRTYRKRSGLSQADVAYLVGSKSRAQISQYERRNSVPPLHTALALQAALNVSVSDLYAGKYDSITQEVHRRAQCLTVELRTKNPVRGKTLFAYKLQWLVERCIPQLLKDK